MIICDSKYMPSPEVSAIFRKYAFYQTWKTWKRGSGSQVRESQIDLINHYLPGMSREDRERALKTIEQLK